MLNDPPSQNGALVEVAGVAGGFGSVRVCGPTALDVHPFSDTRMLSYVPAPSPVIISDPAALDAMVLVTGVPFNVYSTV